MCISPQFFRERMPSIVADWLGGGGVQIPAPPFRVFFCPSGIISPAQSCVAVRVLCPVGGSRQQGRAAGLHPGGPTSRGAHLCRGPSSWGPISEVGRYGSQGPLHLAPLDLHDPEAPFPLPPTLPGPAALEEAGTESSCPIHTSCSVGISLHPLWVGPQAQVSGG